MKIQPYLWMKSITFILVVVDAPKIDLVAHDHQ
jgi:hypothetical protein